MRIRIVTAGAGAAWEAALVQACQEADAPGEVVQRCYDLGDLLAVAAGGRAQVAIVSAAMRWLDREALGRLEAAGLAVVGVVPSADDDTERRLRQLGIAYVARDDDTPPSMLNHARAALAREPLLPPASAGLQAAPLFEDAPPPVPPPHDGRPRFVVAVWGPKGAPGRTSVAVNLAFEASTMVGETLLVDADTYGGSVAQMLGFLEDYPGLAWAARLASRGELDAPRLWQSTRRASPYGPRVLTGLPRAELWTEVRPGTWESLLDLFRVAFPLTVVDAGFCLEEDEELLYDQVRFRRNAVARLAVQRADVVVAVARADPVGLHDFIRAYQELRDLGVPPARVRVVVNQLRGGLFGGRRPDEQIRGALVRYAGLEPAAFVPYDRGGLDAAILAGQALREARPGSPAQQAIAALANGMFGAPRAPSRRAAKKRRGSSVAWSGAPTGPTMTRGGGR